MDNEEQRLAHELLYAVKDVFPDKRGKHDAWTDAINHVKLMRGKLDELHERNKVLEAERAGASTPLTRGA